MSTSGQYLDQHHPLSEFLIPLLGAALVLLAGFWLEAGMAVVCAAAGILLAVLLSRRFEYALYLVFVLIAWAPEYSQTEVNVWSAEDFHSLYNFRPFPQLTASVFDYLFLIVVLVWLWKVVLPEPKKLANPLMLGRAAYAFLGVSIFSLLYGLLRGNPAYYALREFRVSTYFVLVFLMCVTSLRYETVAKRFIPLLLGITLVVSLFGIARHAMGIGRDYYGHRLIYYDIADSILIYTTLLILVSTGFARRHKSFILLGLPMLYVLLFSFRRGAWVGFAVGVLFLLLFRPAALGKRIPLAKVALIMVLLAGAAAIFLSTSRLELVTERFASIADIREDPSNAFRILDALNALNTFVKHPVLGVGFGGRYELEYYSENVAPAMFWESVSKTSHDGYLFILYKTGIVGFAAYFLLLITFMRRWFGGRHRIVDPAAAAVFLALGAAFIGIHVTNLTSPVTDSLRPSLMLAFIMGWAAVLLDNMGRMPTLQRVPGSAGRLDVQEEM